MDRRVVSVLTSMINNNKFDLLTFMTVAPAVPISLGLSFAVICKYASRHLKVKPSISETRQRRREQDRAAADRVELNWHAALGDAFTNNILYLIRNAFHPYCMGYCETSRPK